MSLSDTLTQADILDALRACYDTQNAYSRPVNVVDLGLVESIELTPDDDAPGAGIAGVPRKQRLALTLLKTADEDARTQLAAQIVNRMGGLEGISATTIAFADEPAWSASRITREGRALLGLDAAHFPILNNR